MNREVVRQRGPQGAAESGRIEGAGEDSPAPAPVADTYKDRVLKYIPGEVVAVYVAVDAAVKALGDQAPTALAWLVFAFMFVATPIYLQRVAKVTLPRQLAISTISFAVWVFAVGGPFVGFAWYTPLLGAVLLPLYTFVVALVDA